MNVMEDLKAYIDGEVSPERRAEIESAMEQDAKLRQEIEEIRVLSRLIGECVIEPEPVGLEQTLARLERRRGGRFYLRLFKDPVRYGWAWTMGLFILLAIIPAVFPVFAQSKESAQRSIAMESAKAMAPNAQDDASTPAAQPMAGAGEAEKGRDRVARGTLPNGNLSGDGFVDSDSGRPGTRNGVVTTSPDTSKTPYLTGQGRAQGDLEASMKRLGKSQDTYGIQNSGAPGGSGGLSTFSNEGNVQLKSLSGANVPKPEPPAKQPAAPAPSFAPPLLIRTGELDIQVRDVRSAVAQATETAKTLGGYVEQSSTAADENNVPQAQMTIRVPVDRFDEAVRRLRRFGKILAESSNSNDVTAQVADTEGKLREMRAEEESYLGMLRGAKHIDDNLAVRDRLDSVRQEIASLESQDKSMRSQATYSTITLSFTQEVAAQKPEPKPGWFDTAWSGATERASGLGRWFAEVGMNLLLLAPVWVPVVGLFWWLGRRARTR